MKLGIKRIEFIAVENVADFSYLPAGTLIDLTDFISDGSLSNLEFTQDTANMTSSWVDDDKGRRAVVKVTGCIRNGKEKWSAQVHKLIGKRCIWKICLVNGQVYVLGSRAYVPNFSCDDSVSGISSSEIAFTIALTSTHGLFRHA